VNQDDGRASLSLVTKTSSGCRGPFHPHGDLQKVAYVDYVRYIIGDPTQIERGKRVVC
jgi:hypothetical protein